MKKIIILLSVFCVIAFSFMIITFVSAPSNVDFLPPNFDASAKTGIPEEPGNDWSLISQTNMSFSAHICGQFSVKNKSADVYFTNDDTNVVWLKLRIFDEKGNVLGETGLIKPNEYVEKIFFLQFR